MRTSAIAALCLICAMAPVSAAASGHAVKPKESAAPGTSVEMPYLIAPITMQDKLVAYAYVSCKIVAASPSAAIAVRDKTPFIQDAFVRDVNANPIGKPDDLSTVDAEGLRARLLADTRRVVGAAKIRDLQLIEIQITRLRPDVRS